MAVYLSAKMMISIRVESFAALRIRRHALQASNAAPGRCGETRLRIHNTNSRNSKEEKQEEREQEKRTKATRTGTNIHLKSHEHLMFAFFEFRALLLKNAMISLQR